MPYKMLLSALVTGCLNASAQAAEDYFSMTELQLHLDADRKPLDSDIWTATFEHFSEWRYGDNFFFLDAEGEPDLSASPDTLYFEYAPRLSLNRMFDRQTASGGILGETYLAAQYNGSDRSFINQVWLYGASVDFAGRPHYGFSNLSLYVRREETQDTAWQVTLAWGQPFHLGNWRLVFQGFLDYWENDAGTVLLTEPQLRIPLSNFLSADNVLAKASIGTEIEISRDFFGPGYGTEVNPTLFFAFPF